MTNMDLLDILCDVNGKYILAAQELRSGSAHKRSHPYVRQIAAVLALMLLLVAFMQTAPGAAAVEFVKEKVTSLIETLFPPKKMTILLEGMPYEANYVAGGVEPETVSAPSDISAPAEAAKPGFAIYYDVDSYTMVQEGDTTYIRPYYKPMTREEILEQYKDSFVYLTEEEQEREIAALMDFKPDPSLPPCEMEIVHLALSDAEAAAQARSTLDPKWTVTELPEEYREDDHIVFFLHCGQNPSDPVEDWDFFPDGQGGCFRIIRRYFLEAAEGHGVRFGAILRTFTVMPPQEQER